MTSRSHLIAVLFALAVAQTAAQTPIAAWRAAHERQILDELLGLVAIPNVAGVDADMRRNADHLVALFEKRGFTVERTQGAGSPVVFASLDVPAPRGTIILYIHYDGQPVDTSEWTRCKPFAPCVYAASGRVREAVVQGQPDPEWRVYGRSASDDKGPRRLLPRRHQGRRPAAGHDDRQREPPPQDELPRRADRAEGGAPLVRAIRREDAQRALVGERREEPAAQLRSILVEEGHVHPRRLPQADLLVEDEGEDREERDGNDEQ